MGKKILIIILVLLLAVGGYGFYWFNGLKVVDGSYSTAKMGSTDVNEVYKTVLADSSKGQVTIKGADSEAVTQKLFSETSFFHLAKGSAAKLESVILGVNGDKAEIRMVVDISGVAALKQNKSLATFGATGNLALSVIGIAPPGLPFLNADKFGVKAQLELKTLPEGIGVRPVSINVGKSIILVNLAMNAVKKYAPAAKVTSDNFIVMAPMTVVDNTTGKPLFTISGMEVKDGNLVITTK